MIPSGKIAWSGVVTSVRPRIRLTRSFDQRSHTYQGCVLRIRGTIGEEAREFAVAIGEAAQARPGFQVGDAAGGEGETGGSRRAPARRSAGAASRGRSWRSR